MDKIKILDLFSGIGGFSYAAEHLVGGYKTEAFCEIDPFCQKILKKNFPNVPIYSDVRDLKDDTTRRKRLKSLENSIVPQVVARIFEGIKAIYEQTNV